MSEASKKAAREAYEEWDEMHTLEPDALIECIAKALDSYAAEQVVEAWEEEAHLWRQRHESLTAESFYDFKVERVAALAAARKERI